MTKKMVWVEVDTLYAEGKVDALIESLKRYDSSKGTFRVERCQYEYEDNYYYAIQQSQVETDQQYEHRLKTEKEWADRVTARELAELKRLQEKFGTPAKEEWTPREDMGPK
jgi:hypothetical protein